MPCWKAIIDVSNQSRKEISQSLLLQNRRQDMTVTKENTQPLQHTKLDNKFGTTQENYMEPDTYDMLNHT